MFRMCDFVYVFTHTATHTHLHAAFIICLGKGKCECLKADIANSETLVKEKKRFKSNIMVFLDLAPV